MFLWLRSWLCGSMVRAGADPLLPGAELPEQDVWMHLDYSSPHAYEWIKNLHPVTGWSAGVVARGQ